MFELCGQNKAETFSPDAFSHPPTILDHNTLQTLFSLHKKLEAWCIKSCTGGGDPSAQLATSCSLGPLALYNCLLTASYCLAHYSFLSAAAGAGVAPTTATMLACGSSGIRHLSLVASSHYSDRSFW